MESPTAGRTTAPLALLLALAVMLGASPAFAFETVRCLLADGFDYPVGKPEAKGYHKARGFYPNGHLGEDWDGDGGGDTDLGDPIYAIARGVVILSENVKLGWGNCVIIRHAYREPNGKIEMVDSLYGHLLEMSVKVGQTVQRGELIAKMGNNFGMYPAHLHLEIRKNLSIGMNRMKFAKDYSNYYSPTVFIKAHRQLASDFRKYDIPINTFAPHGEDLNAEQRAFAANLTAHLSSGGGNDAPPPPSTASSKSSSASAEPAEPSAPEVRKTGHGLSIPLNVGGGGSGRASIPKVTTPAQPEPAPAPAPASSDDAPKGDFWSRLKKKLGSGQAVNPDDPTSR